MGSQSLLPHCLSAYPEAPHSAGQGAAPFLKMPPSLKQIKVEFKVKEVLHQTQHSYKGFLSTPRCRSMCGGDVEINTPRLYTDHLSLLLTHPKDNPSRSPKATPSKAPKCMGWENSVRHRTGREIRQGKAGISTLPTQPAIGWRQQDTERVLWWATKVKNLNVKA